MPVDMRTYLDEVTLQPFMKTQTTAIDVLSSTETQKTAQLQGNMQRRVVLRYLHAPFAALQETCIKDRPFVIIDNDTVYCGDVMKGKYLTLWFPKRSRGVQREQKLDLAGERDDECTEKSQQRVSINIGLWTKEREKRLRKRLHRQLRRYRGTSRAKEFEEAWENENPREAHALLGQYSGKMRAVLNVANEVAVEEATLPIWRKIRTLINDMNRRTTATARTPAEFTPPLEVKSGVTRGAVVVPFVFNFAVDDIMRRTVEQVFADISLAPSARLLVDLEYADDVVTFTSSSAKLKYVVSKLAEA
ncbi:hypothetical protein RB195_024071 [Necator americanus]|uniref:Reverse transcriptase domain-containing protein n=1 Tax=Necator americanus TaxID=51031 RepID=A0ABR1ELP9_NECAM